MATKSNSTTTSRQDNFSNTATSGGSHSETSSHTEGGSHSTTQGYSDSTSSTQGGASSLSAGKNYASGTIAENTQANFDKYGQEYVQSSNVANAYNNLQAAISGKPTFQSTYADKLAELYGQVMNRDKFSYNFNEDAMYQLYKDQYAQQGRAAMQDTMGQAAALTGGYGSSYSQAAGQQAYQNYLQQANNLIPELRAQAYQEYQAEGQELLNKYNVTNNAYNNEYAQYRNEVGDWQTDRGFAQSTYADERNFDYGQYTDNRNYWQNEYWQEKNSEQSSLSQTDQSNWSDSKSHTDSFSQTDTSSWSDTKSSTDTSNWSNSTTTGWNTGSSTTNGSSTGGSGSSGTTGTASGSTTQWSHNTASGVASPANITKALYQVYMNEGQQGVDAALKDLQTNGLTVGNTNYSFSQKSLSELQDELDSIQDNIYRYSGGKAGVSVANKLTGY